MDPTNCAVFGTTSLKYIYVLVLIYSRKFCFALLKEPTIKQMTWNGSGNAMNKAISCAEIMKRKTKVRDSE